MAKDAENFKLGLAEKIAGYVVEMLKPACQRVEIAGSIRRQMPVVHDIDLVVWPRFIDIGPTTLFGDGTPHYVPAAQFYVQLGLIDPGQAKLLSPDARIVRLTNAGIPVELYLCEPDGDNFEALLQMRTGSREFNVGLAIRAKNLGAEYRAGYGIYVNGKRIDDGTESGIFASLGMKWIDPERRR